MLRHCTMDELVELRDGSGSHAARVHVGECDACREELDRLHQRVAALKALPALTPPRDRWSAVEQEFVASRRRARGRQLGWIGLAAAAALLLAVGIGSLPSGGASAGEPTDLEALLARSQELNLTLQQVGTERRVMDGYTALAIAELEDRLAAVDSQIQAAQSVGGAPATRDLLERRIALMETLVTSHVQQVASVGY